LVVPGKLRRQWLACSLHVAMKEQVAKIFLKTRILKSCFLSTSQAQMDLVQVVGAFNEKYGLLHDRTAGPRSFFARPATSGKT